MIAKIMVVDDDQKFRESIVRSLVMNDYEVLEASNGKEALGVLTMEHVDLILSDVKMPTLNGIEFLHRIKREKAEIPFIMMTGFSEVIEIKEAYEIGADGFLAKPYREDDLLFQINKIEHAEDEQGQEKQGFIGVYIEEFVAGANIKYPIYIEMDEGNYVKIANEGENLSAKQIQEFKEKGTDYFYLADNDFLKYIEFNYTIKNSILRSSRIENVKKVKFLKILTNHITKYMLLKEVNEEVLAYLVELRSEVVKQIQADNESLQSLCEITSHSEKMVDMYSISAFIGTYLMSKLDWATETVLSDIFAACLLQDVAAGLDESKLSREHPYLSAEIVKQTDLFDDKFCEAVAHHHEKLDGSGFPSGLCGGKINVLGNMVLLATSMAEKIVYRKMTFSDAVIVVLNMESTFYRQEYIDLLKRV